MAAGSLARTLRLALAASFWAGGGGAAAAAPATLTSYRVEPIGQTLLPDSAPLDRGERVVSDGEVVLRGRIAYRAAATVAEPIALSIAGQAIRVRPGQRMAESRARGGAMVGLSNARTFCLAPRRPIVAPGAGSFSRFAFEVQPCLVDRDSDGRFDFAFLAGTRRPRDLLPVPVAAIPYQVQQDLPMEGAEVRISYRTHLTLTSDSLVLGILLPGFDYIGFDSIRVRGADGRMHAMTRDDDVPSRAYPHVLSFGPARFEILGYDPATRQVRLRVLEGFTRSDLELVLLTNGRR